jgi:hypothetical protein
MKKISLLAITPLAIGIAAAIFRSLWIEPSDDVAHIVKSALQLSAITYAIAFVLGAPAYMLIRRFGLRAAWQVTLIGAENNWGQTTINCGFISRH